ncbi:MAG: hypothetical protein ACFFKA_00095 [Candidatus Thorarchaeota archaeon]
MKLSKEFTSAVVELFLDISYGSYSEKLQLKILERADCPVDLLKHLSKSREESILRNIAEHKNTPEDVLYKLSCYNADWMTKAAVAANPNITEKIINRIIKYEDDQDVINELSQNPVFKAEHAVKLSKSKNDCIRDIIAEHPLTPIAVLEKLSKDKEASVQEGVASNPNTPIRILKDLLKSPYAPIRRAAISNPNVSTELLRETQGGINIDERTLFALIKNPNCPPEILEKHHMDRDDSLRGFIARNPNTPTHVLMKYARYHSHGQCRRVKHNPSLPKVARYILECDVTFERRVELFKMEKAGATFEDIKNLVEIEKTFKDLAFG